jgi:S-formylglutathione hydrolase FrmB
MKTSRAQVWLDGLGEWSWPGQGGAAVEALPPPWVPAFPPRREPATVGPAAPGARQPGRARAHRLITGTLLCAIAAVCSALALNGQLTVEHLIGVRTAGSAALGAPAISSAPPAQPLATLRAVSQDAAGSSIDTASYPSVALPGHEGSFMTYLPAGYASTNAHYPVLYMLAGDDQPDTAFLEIGLQGQLDRLIAWHVIPPLIAVMIQGGPGTNLWRNQGALRYESYILEVQELVDRTLPTVPAREARAVVGDSMGGYGAMNVALSNPYRFGVVESWLSFFNGLGGVLHADRPIISRLGLHAFIYGGEQDHIANPGEDAPFAAALRAAGADARSAVYPGEHNLETLQAHLTSMLTFAGRALSTTNRSRPSILTTRAHRSGPQHASVD